MNDEQETVDLDTAYEEVHKTFEKIIVGFTVLGASLGVMAARLIVLQSAFEEIEELLDEVPTDE